MEWRTDTDNAPKDGREFLAYYSDLSLGVGQPAISGAMETSWDLVDHLWAIPVGVIGERVLFEKWCELPHEAGDPHRARGFGDVTIATALLVAERQTRSSVPETVASHASMILKSLIKCGVNPL